MTADLAYQHQMQRFSLIRDNDSPASYFADSAISDMSTITSSPNPKSILETDRPAFSSRALLTDPPETAAQRLERVALPPETPDEQALLQKEREIEELFKPVDSAIPEEDSSEAEAEAGVEAGFVSEDVDTDLDLVSRLSSTVSSLRLRQQEQTHLHDLFISKIEALVQQSLDQEEQIMSLTAKLKTLHRKDSELRKENDTLIEDNHRLQGELTNGAVAVDAMTGAVRGLEGWIQSLQIHAGTAVALPATSPLSPPAPLREPKSRQSLQVKPNRQETSGQNRIVDARQAVRGRGRFRGRYSIHHRADHIENDLATATLTQPSSFTTSRGDKYIMAGTAATTAVPASPTDTMDGILAWLRGFKDIEDSIMAMKHSWNHPETRWSQRPSLQRRSQLPTEQEQQLGSTAHLSPSGPLPTPLLRPTSDSSATSSPSLNPQLSVVLTSTAVTVDDFPNLRQNASETKITASSASPPQTPPPATVSSAV